MALGLIWAETFTCIVVYSCPAVLTSTSALVQISGDIFDSSRGNALIHDRRCIMTQKAVQEGALVRFFLTVCCLIDTQ
ncbi:hypothetical protein BDZ94DRAFT_1262325 [Collybia nuda]|uniref:Secreted protein n=1 Tax=Collybia nuda TaxID=64659 RepID=A0A9P5Y6A5_9AGAR|nr:hypothetical protein BDZ94DRAFT_1262325 [Collybia nuda]